MARSSSCAVASAHPLSTAAGLEVLREGGNAFDAALAVSAALPVVQPHMNGLGSDFFALVRDRSTVAVSSSGPAGRNADPDWFYRNGLHRVPARGPLASITVPGLVAAWTLLGRNLSLGWRRDLAPAIRWARDGFPASPSLVRSARSFRWGDRDFDLAYRAARRGGSLRQPWLAATLSRIAHDEGHAFYHGALAKAICRDLRKKGGLLEPEDLDGFSPRTEAPLRVRYRGSTIETTPPPSQGAAALVWLNLLSREELSGAQESALVRTLVRSMRVAYRYRAQYIGDPEVLQFPRSLLRSDAVYDLGRPPRRQSPAESDTTAFSVYDGSVGISAIQSNYGGFGSGVVIRRTGIALNNRGSYFTLEPGHPNRLAPGKRTFHTLMATVVSGPRTVLLGSMGGDVQPQVNVQVLVRHLDRGMPLADAIAAPRFAYPASIYGTAPLFREAGVPLPGARILRGRAGTFGHAQGISIGDTVEVGADPRGDGLLPLPS